MKRVSAVLPILLLPFLTVCQNPLPDVENLARRLESLSEVAYFDTLLYWGSQYSRDKTTAAAIIPLLESGLEKAAKTSMPAEKILPYQFSFHLELAKTRWALERFVEGQTHIMQALDLAEKIRNINPKEGNTALGKAWVELGNIYMVQEKNDQAVEAYQKAMAFARAAGSELGYAVCLNSIGLIHLRSEKFRGALPLVLESAKLFMRLDKKNYIVAQVHVAWIYLKLGELERADSLYNALLDVAPRYNPGQLYFIYTGKGKTLVEQNRPAEGIEWYAKAHPYLPSIKEPFIQSGFYNALSEAYEKNGQMDEALKWYKEYKKIGDSLLIHRNDAQLLNLQAQFELNLQKEKAREARLVASRNKAMFWAAITGLMFVAGVASLLVYREQQRRKALREAVSRDREAAMLREQLYVNLTHELRTPLTLVISPLEKLSTEQPHPDLERALQNARDLLRRFNDVLHWKKLEDKAMKVTPKMGDLVETVQKIVAQMKPAAEYKNIRLSFRSSLPEKWGELDVDKLETIFSNLVINSIKYTPQSGWINVTLDFPPPTDTYSFLYLKITDNGEGIPAEKISAIFDRYQQGEQSSYQSAGAGIGLALVKGLVQLLGGSVEVTSDGIEGAEFTVTLPFRPMNAPAPQPAQHHVPRFEEAATPLPSLVLLVEDNPGLQDFIASALGTKFTLLLATTVEQGLNQAKEHLPDIVVTDIMLPGESDGIALCRQLKTHPLTCHIPVITLTARTGFDTKADALDAGADAHLTKPFSIKDLELTVQSILYNRRILTERLRNSLQMQWSKDASPTNDPFLERVFENVRREIDNPAFGVEQLAEVLRISRVQLFKKTKALTGLPPADLLRNLRLAKAKFLLETGAANVSEAAYQTGFTSPNYFSKAFKKHFGSSPSKIAEKPSPTSIG